jgi:U3 small nucleolar RNA-associated protein 21
LMDELDWSSMGVRITGCRHHAGNNLAAFSCDDKAIRVVDTETRRTIREFRGPKMAINDFCFSTDGGWIIAASEDCTIRTWDLPTGHLIDAMRFAAPCKAVAMSENQQFLAIALAGKLGVGIWTNRGLFTRVNNKPISETDIAPAGLPSTSGVGNAALVPAGLDDEEAADEDPAALNAEIDQLSVDLMTLSTVPKAKWQTLLHLDLIKQRNKPKEPPKAPEKAPFFLSSSLGNSRPNELEDRSRETIEDPTSRLLRYDKARDSGALQRFLRDGAASGECKLSSYHGKAGKQS